MLLLLQGYLGKEKQYMQEQKSCCTDILPQESCFTDTLPLSTRILFYWHLITVYKSPSDILSLSPFLVVFVWFKFSKFWIVLSFLMQKYMIIYYIIFFLFLCLYWIQGCGNGYKILICRPVKCWFTPVQWRWPWNVNCCSNTQFLFIFRV